MTHTSWRMLVCRERSRSGSAMISVPELIVAMSMPRPVHDSAHHGGGVRDRAGGLERGRAAGAARHAGPSARGLRARRRAGDSRRGLASRPRSGRDWTGMRLVSLNVGLPQEVEWRGRTVRTAIVKAPVEGRRRVDGLNVDG